MIHPFRVFAVLDKVVRKDFYVEEAWEKKSACQEDRSLGYHRKDTLEKGIPIRVNNQP